MAEFGIMDLNDPCGGDCVGVEHIHYDFSQSSERAELLDEAKKIITGDRNVQYGEPTADFTRTAALLNALEFTVSGQPLQPHHIAIIGIALKMSRLTWSPQKRDHWLDVAGYSGCGWECVNEHVE